MANILDKFKDSSVGSSGRIFDYLPKINSSGDFTKVYDINAILTSWNNILITPVGSYDHDPEFGSNLYLKLFEPSDEITRNAIKDEIKAALNKYDNRANIIDIRVTYLKNKKGFSVSIIVNYFGVKSQLDIVFNEQVYQNYLK